jgi:hypothetical protein
MQEDPEIQNSIEPRLRYEKPVLITYGRVRDLTAGGTMGGLETAGQGDCFAQNMTDPINPPCLP